MNNQPIGILDSGPAITRQVRRVLKHNKILTTNKNAKRYFYTTGNEKLYNIKAERVRL